MALLEIPEIEEHERFRAQLASVDQAGKRRWVYARKPSGVYYRWRTAVAWVLLAFFIAAPVIKVDGQQFLLFDILNRRFVLLGFPFWPQDFYIVAVLFLAGIVTIVLITATLGRVWCGWACPQTIFLEMIFRKIEWLIDGTPGAQIRRNHNGWPFSRVWRFALKQSIFFAISFFIANLFLSYVVSTDTLRLYITEGPAAHIELFAGLASFTAVFYLVFARFREQACLIVCPYGRFMSALVDDNTITVTYDSSRGEPRSKWQKNDPRREAGVWGTGYGKSGKGKIATDNHVEISAERSEVSTIHNPPYPIPQTPYSIPGDCIDCYQCVTVCPTGIDIRNGIQLECVACTACIDACDLVMDKTGLPRGLIRYTSSSAIQAGNTKWSTARVKAYLAIWIAVVGVAVTLLATRSVLDVTILRSPGTTWTTTASGGIANFYDIQIINKSAHDLPYSLTVRSPMGAEVTPLGLPASVAKGTSMKGRFLITLPAKAEESAVKIDLAIVSGNKEMKRVKTEFLTP